MSAGLQGGRQTSMHFVFQRVSDDGDVDVFNLCDSSGELQPWVRVRDSLMLANHLQSKGKGLYAWQQFPADMRIGKYTGKLVALATQADSLVSSSDKLLTWKGVIVDGAQSPQSKTAQETRYGKSLCDPMEYPGMFHFRANDAHNTPMQNNCLVDQHCYMVTVEHVKAVY